MVVHQGILKFYVIYNDSTLMNFDWLSNNNEPNLMNFDGLSNDLYSIFKIDFSNLFKNSLSKESK
jgi:hypothetical protein